MAGVQSKHCDDSFVGREEEIQGVIQEWENGKQLFPIYGIDSIGKTCFAHKLFMCLQSQGYCGQIPDYEFELNGIADLKEMIEIMTEELEINGQGHNERTWIQHISSFLKKQVNKDQNKNLVLFFKHYGSIDDKIELKNAFAKLCNELVGCSPRIKIFFTSNIKIRFAKKQKWCHSSHLWLLNDKESKEMLRNLLKDKHVDLGRHEERIIELCEGLPLALMIVANGLAEEDNMLESELMKDLLEVYRLSTLSPDYYAEHERMRNVIGDPIKKLKDVFQKSMASLANLRGSFDKESGAQAVGARNTAEFMHKDMIKLTRSCFYKFNSKTRMFDCPDMQTEHVCTDILRHQDCSDTKENLRQIYNGRLQGLEKELKSNSTLTVSDQDSATLRGLVDIGLHYSRSGGFPDFIQTMVEANLFDTKHFNKGSFDVFEVMISQCHCPQLKTFFEKGIPLSILAKMIIHQKTGKMYDLHWCHQEAEAGQNGPSQKLADLFQQLGWRYLLGGDRSEALKYHKQSHEVLTKLQQTKDLLFASCLNGLGFMYAVCGNWPEAMWHFFRSVQLRVQFLGDEDIALDIQCHNITLLCHMRQDCHKDHTISEFRLEEKKDTSTPNLTVARCCLELGTQFLQMNLQMKQADRAYEVVKYGLDISSKKGSSEINFTVQADLCSVAIDALRSLKDLNQKESCLKGMLKHLRKDTPAWKTTLTELGLVLLDLKRIEEAEKAANEVLATKCSPIDSMSRSVFEICHRLVVVYTNLKNREKAVQWYNCAIEEIHRLGDDEECRKIFREIERLVIDTAKEKRPNAPIPKPSNDQGSACLRAWYSPESRKAAMKEKHVGLTSHKNASSGIPRSSKSSASDLAAGQDPAGDSKGFPSPCTAPRSHQNEIPLRGERISQPHHHTGAGFSPPGDFSPVNNYHSAHVGDGDFCARPSMSRGHVQDVHLSNHNNSPHSPDTRADRDLSSFQENDEEGNGMASGTSVPSDNRSDLPNYQNTSSPNQRPSSEWTREGRSNVTPTSPVESSWPTASLSLNTADNPATHCLVTGTSGQGWGIPHEQRVPDEANSAIGQGEVGSNLTDSGCAQADSSISLAPCLVSDVGQEQSSLTSVTCVPPQHFVTGGQTHVKEIDEQNIGLSAVPRQQNMVPSLGVGSVQKINENEHLHHDHFRPTSRGHREAQSSRMDECPRQPISGRQSNTGNLNLNFEHTNSETIPKELVSGVPNSGNAVGRVTPVITGDNRRRVSEPTRPGDGLLPLNPGIPRRETGECQGSYAEITRSSQNHVKYPNPTQNITNISSVVENPQGPLMTGTSDFSGFQQEPYEPQFGALPPKVLRGQTQFISGSVSSPPPLSLSERDTLIPPHGMPFDPYSRQKMYPNNTFGCPYQGREQPLESDTGSIPTPFPPAYASDSMSNVHASVSQEYSHSLQKYPDHAIQPQPRSGHQGISFDQNQNNHAMQQSLQSRPRLHYPPNTPWQPPSQNPNGVDTPGGCPTAHKAPLLSQLFANTLGWVRQQWSSNTHSQNDSTVIHL